MEACSGVNYINEKEEDCDELSSAVDQMPPGFRFHPTDAEIIDYYLLKKVMDRWFQSVAVGEINLNKCEPWDLPEKANSKMGEKEWFFFFEKETKYPSGMRSNRATASGYWKATGKDKEIYNAGAKRRVVGMKKTLVFYRGRAPKGEKMNWVIHEYRLQGDYSAYNLSAHAKEKWVVCKVFHKKNQTNPAHVDGGSLLDTTPAPHQLIQASTLMLNNNYMFPHHPIIQYSAHTPSSSSLVYQHHHTINGADTMESINGTQSKRPCDEVELEALGISPNISDLDSLWAYY